MSFCWSPLKELRKMKQNCRYPGFFKVLIIQAKLRTLNDPIQKLSYLQRVANLPSVPCARRYSVCLSTALFILILFGFRIQTATDANAGLPRANRNSNLLLSQYADAFGPVWAVEHRKDYEVYSNGLRIENRHLNPTQVRSYVVFHSGQSPDKPGGRCSQPAGIVFHTSESVQAPFRANENDNLARLGRGLLEYVSRHSSYHFVIDRFGRVFRMVPETDVANHAGYSIWAEKENIYINLNHSFLGVSFEAQTKDIDQGLYLSPAQINSGRLLVQMLVNKYRLPLTNCVTHAQVSVNPDSMIIGYHTDGSGDFPFRELGLPDNYTLPLPSVFIYGFDFDPRVLQSTGFRMWKGLLLADEQLRREAVLRQITLGQYKHLLRERYRTSIATLKNMGVIKEN
jgi:hypothetical protein